MERRAPRHRLAFRYGLALCLGAAAILFVAGYGNISLQREHMTRLVSMSADRIADTVLRSTRSAMLENDPGDLLRMIQVIGSQPGIERIRIFDKQGRVQTSTRHEEVHTMVDKRAEQCYGCHRADQPIERLDRPDRVRIFGKPGGERIFGIIAPIRNEIDCATAACHAHPADTQVLGVLDVQLSLGPVDRQLQVSELQLFFGLLGTTAALLLLAGALTWRMVLRPVRRLTEASRAVTAGDLTVRTPVTSSDEIGEMSASWNAMVEEVARSRREREEWNRTLEQRIAGKTGELEKAHEHMLLVEKMASLGKLAAVVAHEVNNPLAGIQTYARLLKRQMEGKGEGAGGGETLKALDLMEREAARCGGIVRNLLLFSRTPGARFAIEPLPPLIERCLMLVKHQAELQNVEVRQEIGQDLRPVECDASQVQQMLLALCMNAIEAMPRGGILTVGARPDPEDAEGALLHVTDTGVGIPKEHLSRIFEPFFTTKEEGKGVGLGLAVVYGIVERHRGRIDVASTPGTGTTFTIHLPGRQPDAAGGGPPGPPGENP